MAPTQTSLTEHVTPIAAGAEVVAAAFLGRTPAFALADGTILRAGIGEEQRVTAHSDAIVLIGRALGNRLVTGGDDGRIVETRGDAAPVEIGNMGSKWIDALALRDDGATVWSAGKDVRARDAKGDVLAGETAFKLYDTYGFPLDLTQDAVRAMGLTVDLPGFAKKVLKPMSRSSRSEWQPSS